MRGQPGMVMASLLPRGAPQQADVSRVVRGSHLIFLPLNVAPLLLQVLWQAFLLPHRMRALQLQLPVRLGLLHTWVRLLLLLGLLG